MEVLKKVGHAKRSAEAKRAKTMSFKNPPLEIA